MKKSHLLLATLMAGFLIAESLPSPSQMGVTPIYDSALVNTAIRVATCTLPFEPVMTPQPDRYVWHNANLDSYGSKSDA